MLGGSWACSLRKLFLKKNKLGAFWCFFAYYIRDPQTRSFACYMQPYSGPFLSFLAYHIWRASTDQFLRTEYGSPFRSVSSLIMEASLNYVWFFFMLYGDPLDHFFAYYIGAPRSLSLLTIWGLSDHFLLIQYGSPSQISFVVYYMGPLSDQFLCML